MKAIEEIASSIATDFITENRSLVNKDAPLIWDCVEYTLNRIMKQPLSDRITAEEREKIQTILDMPVFDAIDAVEFVESIFGEGIFAEEGGYTE